MKFVIKWIATPIDIIGFIREMLFHAGLMEDMTLKQIVSVECTGL